MTTLLTGGTVWAGDPPTPVRAGWVLVGDDDRIAAIGTTDDVPPAAGMTVDLEGGHLLPGLVDVHTHLSTAAWGAIALDGRGWRCAADVMAAVGSAAQTTPTAGWIIGQLADLDRLRDRPPSADSLDDAADGRPVVIADRSLHRGLTSTAALDRAGVLAGHVPGQDITRWRGVPTGLVWEHAFGRVWARAVNDLIRDGIDPLPLHVAEARLHLSMGLTHVHDPGVDAAAARLLGAASVETGLPISWSPALAGDLLGGPDAPAAEAAPPSVKTWLDGGHRCALRVSPRVLLTAASAQLRRAAATRDAAALIDLVGQRVTRDDASGQPVVAAHRRDDDELTSALQHWADDGVRLRLHAVGNAAVDQVGRVLDRLGRPPATVEHVTVADDRSVAALADTGATASVQPGFVRNYATVLRDLGVADNMLAIPLRSLAAAGVPLAISSDHPCGPLDPLANLRAAVTRRWGAAAPLQASEGLEEAEAVAAASVDARRALGLPPQPIGVGEPATFTEVDTDPFDPAGRVHRTWIAGSVVWGPGWRS